MLFPAKANRETEFYKPRKVKPQHTAGFPKDSDASIHMKIFATFSFFIIPVPKIEVKYDMPIPNMKLNCMSI